MKNADRAVRMFRWNDESRTDEGCEEWSRSYGSIVFACSLIVAVQAKIMEEANPGTTMLICGGRRVLNVASRSLHLEPCAAGS